MGQINKENRYDANWRKKWNYSDSQDLFRINTRGWKQQGDNKRSDLLFFLCLPQLVQGQYKVMASFFSVCRQSGAQNSKQANQTDTFLWGGGKTETNPVSFRVLCYLHRHAGCSHLFLFRCPTPAFQDKKLERRARIPFFFFPCLNIAVIFDSSCIKSGCGQHAGHWDLGWAR